MTRRRATKGGLPMRPAWGYAHERPTHEGGFTI